MIIENPKNALHGWRGVAAGIAVVIHVLMNIAYCGFGVTIIVMKPAACEQTYHRYHMRKYITFSVVLCATSLFTYFVFSRVKCKESVRGRATALLILHFAFTAWGVLTWRQMDPSCANQNGSLLFDFQHVSVVFNGAYFLFLIMHEMFPPKADWTVMPKLECGPPPVDFTSPEYQQVENWHRSNATAQSLETDIPVGAGQPIEANMPPSYDPISQELLTPQLQREFDAIMAELAPKLATQNAPPV